MHESQGLPGWLANVADSAQAAFLDEHNAREQTLRMSRDIIRHSANSIRATHRGEFEQAEDLIAQVAALASEIAAHRDAYPRVYYGGFAEDALKEYAEAAATLAFVRGEAPPRAADLGIGTAPYINGLAEAVGELRRYALDSLRRDDFSNCERALAVMDEVYAVLVTMDFPEAVTGGLRRRTDAARGILERTRGDVTLALRQRRLEERLELFEKRVTDPQNPAPSGPP